MKKYLFFIFVVIVWGSFYLVVTAGEISTLQSVEKQEKAQEIIVETEIVPNVESPVTETMTGEEINWYVISSGGDIGGTSTSYILSGTIGQTAVGAGASTSYYLSHGFWQEFSSGGCCLVAGDANHDSSMNIADASYIINKIFFGGADYACSQEADANADGNANIADASYIINAIFFGGSAPVCGPA